MNKLSLTSKSTIGGVSSKDGGRMVDEDRAFFCSELIAKAYKECMIMEPTDAASASFNPGDFSQRSNKIKLVKAASLSQEMLVMTDAMFKSSQAQLKG